MNKYLETFNTWNKIAKQYQDLFMDLDLYNKSYDVFLNLIQKNDANILEIGCGPGNISKYFLNKKPKLKWLGTDVSENMIDLAKVNNPTGNFIIMDCRNINKIDANFNAIVCGFCIPYLSKKDCLKLFKDCNDLLLPQGIIYLSYVEGPYKNSGFIQGSQGDRTYFYYHNSTDIKNKLHINQFKIIHTEQIDYNKSNGEKEKHTVVIAKKQENKIL